MNLWTHVSAAGALSLLTLAPLPLALVVAGGMQRGSASLSTCDGLLIVALNWFALQLILAMLLAFLGIFTLPATLIASALLLLIGVVCGRWMNRRSPLGPVLSFRLPASSRTGIFLALFALVALLLLGNLLLQPVTDYDSLYYHLPFMANLHAAGHLLHGSVAPVVAWYPYGWETLATLALLPVASDTLVALPNLLVWGLLGLALYAIMRQLAVNRAAALATTLLFLCQPLVLDQLNSLRVDLALAAFFWSGVALLLRGFIHIPEQDRPRSLLSFGMLALFCMAILPAIKTSGLIYAALLALLFVLMLLRRRRVLGEQSRPWLRGLLVPIVILLLIALTTATWYLRNWWTYGNPLGTVAVHLGPWLLFPGSTTSAAIRQTTLATLFDFTDTNHLQLYARQLWQQGNLSLLGMLAFAAIALLGLRTNTRRWRTGAVTVAVLLLTLLYWVTPYSGDDGSFGYQLNGPWVGQAMRFALPVLGALALLAALGLQQFVAASSRQAEVALVVAGALALGTLAQRSTLYLLAVSCTVLLVVLYTVGRQRWRAWSPSVAMRTGIPDVRGWFSATTVTFFVCAALVMPVALALPFVEPLRAERRLLVYGELPTLVDALTVPGTQLAALHSHQSYLANGQRLQRVVVQLPLTLQEPSALEEWLTDKEIELIVVGPLRPEWQNDPRLAWLADPTQPYVLLYDGSPLHPQLYQLTK